MLVPHPLPEFLRGYDVLISNEVHKLLCTCKTSHYGEAVDGILDEFASFWAVQAALTRAQASVSCLSTGLVVPSGRGWATPQRSGVARRARVKYCLNMFMYECPR